MEATLREFLDHAPVFLRTPEGEILYWTEGSRELYGFTAEEAQGRLSHELLRTQFSEDLAAIQERLLDRGEWTGRLRQTTKHGRAIWTVAVWRLRQSTDPAGWIVIEQNTDITSQVELEEQRAILARELEHRVKNLLTVVQSLALNSFPNAPAEQRRTFENRLVALAEANRLLREAAWDEAELREIICEVAGAIGIEDRLRLEGPNAMISSQQVMSVALTIHELCTNALKHGSLSVPTGWVEVTWTTQTSSQRLALRWEERGGPRPKVPSRTGFGTRLIQSAVAGQLGSPIELRFEPTGLICDIRLSLAGTGDN
jgi:two-component system CheB/CheR fusion protein